MAIVKNNLITEGLSGKLGNMLVFRNMGNKTIVSTVPKANENPSEDQKLNREKFQSAVIYRKSAISEPTTKLAYKKAGVKEGLSAYNVAVADFYNASNSTLSH